MADGGIDLDRVGCGAGAEIAEGILVKDRTQFDDDIEKCS